jgi:ectoine hydroxylase-related dioxygenase (phytanoyl-CoA dioxygenase family)
MSIPRYRADTPASEIMQGLTEAGCAVIESLVDQSQVDAISAELDPIVDAAPKGQGHFVGFTTKRISGLIKKVPASRSLAAHPLILELMDGVLLPNCDRHQIHITQAISVGPGSPAQFLHRDRMMFAKVPWTMEPMVNVMWAITEFTEQLGATRVVPGSNHWGPDRMPDDHEVVSAEMPSGSCFLYLGSTIHGAGANRTYIRRNGIVFGYCLGWLRQYENQYLQVPPEVAATLPKELASLIGYAAHRPHLGLYETRDPIEFLYQGLPENLAPEDVPDAASQKLLEQVLAARAA